MFFSGEKPSFWRKKVSPPNPLFEESRFELYRKKRIAPFRTAIRFFLKIQSNNEQASYRKRLQQCIVLLQKSYNSTYKAAFLEAGAWGRDLLSPERRSLPQKNPVPPPYAFTNLFSRFDRKYASQIFAASGRMYGSTQNESAVPNVIALPARTETTTNHTVPNA